MKRKKIITKNVPSGFTFVEAIISMLILAIVVGGLFTCLMFVAGSARRSATETEGNMHAIKALELLSEYPYDMIITNYFPTEYVEDTYGYLIYAITTTITEVHAPTLHKTVTIDYTWREGGVARYTKYYFVKPE